jgi:hypothetical protein
MLTRFKLGGTVLGVLKRNQKSPRNQKEMVKCFFKQSSNRGTLICKY